MSGRIVVAYSGGPWSTAAISRLAARPGDDVVALAVGLGQGGGMAGIRERAIAAGARRCHVLDLEEAFARELVWPAIRAGVDETLSANAVAAPLLARALADVARVERAPTVGHGARGRAARQLQASLQALDPALRVTGLDPHELAGPSQVEAYREAHGVPVSGDMTWQVEQSLWGRSVTGAAVAHPWMEPPPDAFALTRPAGAAPGDAARLDVAFERGTPVSLNGVGMPVVELLASVGTIAGVHGVGRYDLAGLDDEGRTWREVREAPALATLGVAHEALTRLTLTPGEATLWPRLGDQYTSLLLDGAWHAPVRRVLDASVDAIQARVTGVVRLRLFKGRVDVIGRRVDGPERPVSHRSIDVTEPATS